MHCPKCRGHLYRDCDYSTSDNYGTPYFFLHCVICGYVEHVTQLGKPLVVQPIQSDPDKKWFRYKGIHFKRRNPVSRANF